MSRDILARLLRENPIVVTGMGVHCAAGSSVPEVWQRVLAGIPTAQWLPRALTGTEIPTAGCRTSDPTPSRHTHKLDRAVKLGWAAAEQAWRAAGLDIEASPARPSLDRVGVFCGTSRGPMEALLSSSERDVPQTIRPTLATRNSLACLSGAIARGIGARGPCSTVSAACASAASAIAFGAQQILTGTADLVVAGGAEAPLNPMILAQLDSTGILGSNADPALTCRPFDSHRNGTVLGEGAAFLVLESLDSARKRGATPLARLAGWSIRSDASLRAGMDESGASLAQVIEEALRNAGVCPADVGYLNTHGTGTRLNDLAEARAIHRIFGTTHRNVPCSSTKPVTGHCLGASAAIEAVIGILALQHSYAPLTGACEELDESCEINVTRGAAIKIDPRAVLSISSGFWGNQAALVFSTPAP